MIVTAYKQSDGIFISFEFLKNIINQEFTQLIVDINIIEYKNEIVRKTRIVKFLFTNKGYK